MALNRHPYHLVMLGAEFVDAGEKSHWSPRQLSIWQRLRQNTTIDTVIDVVDWYPKHYWPIEKSLLKKLDSSLLIFACFSFFAKYLDQSNLTNAYVSGMKEAVSGMGGNALNYAVMAWTGAYVVGQIPGLLIQSRPSFAAYLLPTLEIVWAILTFAQASVTKSWQVYLLRALLGFTEAPSFGATHFLLGLWFTKEELFKRAGTWFTCNALGTMVSGYLQTAALNNPHLFGHIAPWRALLILDGIITLPVAFIGFAFFPGLPSGTKPWFMTQEEHALATTRLGPSQRTKAEKISLKTFTRTLKMPLWWTCVSIYIFLIQAHYWTGYMSLWLKSEPSKFSIQERNTLPTFQYIIAAFASWFGTSLGARISVLKLFSVAQTCMTFSLVVLIVWSVPDWLKFLDFYLAGTSGLTSPVLYSWVNNSMRSDPEARALTISSMMAAGYSTQIWVPLLTFPTVEAPRYPKGYPASLAFLLAMWLLFTGAVLHTRRSTAAWGGIDAEASSAGSSITGELEEMSDEKDSSSKTASNVGEAAQQSPRFEPVLLVEKAR